jgi:putative transcriptional regulator
VKISHWAVLFVFGAVCASAQSRLAELAPGRFLVASRQLSDPNFAETVVVILHHDRTGTGGLIINRASDKPLSDAIDLAEAKGRGDRVYAGGPVARTGLRALIRSRTKLDKSSLVLDDVYVVSNRTVLQRALAGNDAVRVYFGYCGWAAGQLERELLAHAWHVMPGSAKMIFDAEPESVWARLISQTDLRLVRLRFVGGRAVETGHGHVVQSQIHRELTAVMNQMVQHHGAQNRNTRHGEDHVLAVP